MRRAAAALACFLVLTVEALSDSQWKSVTGLGINSGAVLNSITTSGNLALASISGDAINKSVRSTDGGLTWESPLPVLAPLKLKSLNSTFLYGVRGDSIMTSINNQGLSWSIANASVNLNMNLADVHYISFPPGQAWAVGDSPYVSVTADGWGNFVNRRFPDDSVSMTSVQFLDNNFGFAAGRSTKAGSNAGVILRTIDGGQSWQDRSLPDVCGLTAPILVIDFITPRLGWAVQTCNVTATIYKTADSGSTWSPQDTITISRIFAIDAVDSLHAWAVGQVLGSNGAIAKTSNGGSSWDVTQPPSSSPLLSIAMRDNANGFACGQAATLLVYAPVSTDVPGEHTNRPKSFELSQNYPNPFNGETRIAFTLQKSQPVTLTVYNILGQPIRTLIEGIRPVGKNEVSWDGRDGRGFSVPSGIYLYKLNTREEKQVRKMVLLK